MSSSHLVINEDFFRHLWPLILYDNICDTRSKNTSPYFVPKQRFDALWAHGFLASKDYGDYEPPIAFHYPRCAEKLEENSSDSNLKRTSIQLDDEGTTVCKFTKGSRILTLDEQLAELERQNQYREKLANDFKNRTIPWYIPCCRSENDIMSDLQTVFTEPFEREIIRTIFLFDCKFMIINLGAYFCLGHIENWLKFCKYLKIVLIVRKADIAEQLTRLNPAFYTLLFQDICENTWQQELTRALNLAVAFAKEAKITTDSSMAFVYVFCSHANLDCLNKFIVLRKT